MIDEVRAFNRAYTRQIGVLGDQLLGSEFSLSEMRVRSFALAQLAIREGELIVDDRPGSGIERERLLEMTRGRWQEGARAQGRRDPGRDPAGRGAAGRR